MSTRGIAGHLDFFCPVNFPFVTSFNPAASTADQIATMGKKGFRVSFVDEAAGSIDSYDQILMLHFVHVGKESSWRRWWRRRRRRRTWKQLERLPCAQEGECEAPGVLRLAAAAPRGGEDAVLGGAEARAAQQLPVLRFKGVGLGLKAALVFFSFQILQFSALLANSRRVDTRSPSSDS